MPTKIVYSISATAHGGGRDGQAKTEDGAIDLKMRPPKEMGGSGDGANPEQLFATGYAACFLGAMRHYAGQKKVEIPDDASVTAEVGIGPREDTGFGLSVSIKVSLPGMDRATAEDIVAGGHEVCPYSNALTKGVSVTPELA
ncbi:organic hydroperoxide resistance protein [Roseivivax sediminis]|uniref:Peroxiredoxin, Ohr subfamily n=1 Tax=Roseivivax sediminis TaxID=936889 RepID=A0A1I1UHR5_9RHOB|nr:organic hydroperoxide resistance protein [Roseivivax sediminis]SFD68303.1 peroxiredoxin, Ohr subfamily [Roseivivax sediminis]